MIPVQYEEEERRRIHRDYARSIVNLEAALMLINGNENEEEVTRLEGSVDALLENIRKIASRKAENYE